MTTVLVISATLFFMLACESTNVSTSLHLSGRGSKGRVGYSVGIHSRDIFKPWHSKPTSVQPPVITSQEELPEEDSPNDSTDSGSDQNQEIPEE